MNTLANISTLPNADMEMWPSLATFTLRRNATYMLANITPFPHRYNLLSMLLLKGDSDSDRNRNTAESSSTTAICEMAFGRTNTAAAVNVIRRPHSTTS